MTLLYIASDNRSGSTLLDLLLGNHPEMTSIGELQYLHEFYQAGKDCTCGAALNDCAFWGSVQQHLAEDGDRIENLPQKPPRRKRWFGLRPLLTQFLLAFVPLRMLRFAAHFSEHLRLHIEAAENSWKIIDAAKRTTRSETIVDSSKRGDHCKLLYFLRPQEFKMIHLIRDGRGVSCSRMVRRRTSFWRAAVAWCVNNLLLLSLQRAIPSNHKIIVKYEDLCGSPERELRRVCQFVGLPFHEAVLQLDKHDRHNIAGSPRRWDRAETQIELDDRWTRLMGRKERLQFWCVGGWLNRYFSYR